jgi:hypothetical protein
MNSKGHGEALMFFSFMFIMLILGAGVVWGTLSFIGNGYDGRASEAAQLGMSVEECITSHNVFAPGFDIFASCDLNKEIINDKHMILIYSKSDSTKVLTFGVNDYVNQCSLSGARKNGGYPRCLEGTVYRGNEPIGFVVGSNQRSQRFIYG